MNQIEIPLQSEKDWRYRLFEILPGFLSWSILALPFVLSLINTRLIIFFIVCYFIIWFMRAIGLNLRVIQGFRTMKQHEKLPWNTLLEELENGEVAHGEPRPKWHFNNLQRLSVTTDRILPSEVIHAIIIPSYNESRAIIEPTIQALLDSHYDPKKVILVMAYEARDGAQALSSFAASSAGLPPSRRVAGPCAPPLTVSRAP